ncbi:MAG: SPFH domain-containing protein [Phycisphaerae bacterium]
MKNIGTIAAAAIVVTVLLLYMCTFQVRFTEAAIVKTFGEPAKQAITEPGLQFKWPPPIQTLVKYDKRIRILEDRTEETRTVDGKNLVLTTFTLWRLGTVPGDVIKFHTNFPGGVADGEKKLRTTVVTHKHAVIGQREFAEFVSIDPKRRKLAEIEDEIRQSVAADAREQYGIEIVDFGIKKLGLPQAVTKTIFGSMKANEEVKAGRYEAEGRARAQAILADANATEQRITAAAREKVAAIENEADKVVSDYYQEFAKHPELRIFLDSLRAIKKALSVRTTLILDQNDWPWSLFSEEARSAVHPDAEAAVTPETTPGSH